MVDKYARIWSGSEWVNVSAPIGIPNAVAVYQSSAPPSPVTGQVWIDSDDKNFYVWSGSSWIQTTINLSSYLTISSAAGTYLTQANAATLYASISSELYTMTVALSDEETAISTGTNKITVRAPFAMTLTQAPRASVNTVSSSGNPSVDINKNGVSIFSTVLSIDAGEKTSFTATTPAVLSTTSIADDDELTFDIDTSGTGAKGLKITLYYKRS